MRVILKENCEKYNPRYIITDDEGKVIDDAQGYGFKSKQKAYKAMYYNYRGGKQKKHQKQSFFRKNPKIEKFINDIYEINFKEISRGEATKKDIKKAVKKEFDVDIPTYYLN